MFVPKAGGRTTRRRQRTSSDDSVKPPKAKRQRSVLRRPDESPSDTNLGREIAKLTSSRPNGDSIPTDLANTDSHIVSRTVKQSGALTSNEGTIVLVGGSHLLARLLKP
jgi:nuclear pore complex protein Nup133